MKLALTDKKGKAHHRIVCTSNRELVGGSGTESLSGRCCLVGMLGMVVMTKQFTMNNKLSAVSNNSLL